MLEILKVLLIYSHCQMTKCCENDISECRHWPRRGRDDGRTRTRPRFHFPILRGSRFFASHEENLPRTVAVQVRVSNEEIDKVFNYLQCDQKKCQMSIKVARNWFHSKNFETFTKKPKNVGDLGKLIFAKGFKELPQIL